MDIDLFFQNVCRVCSNHLNNEKSVALNYSEQATTFATPMFDTFGITISTLDGLPKHICSKCIRTLQEVLQFKGKIQKTDVKLRTLLSKTYFENGKRLIKPDVLGTLLPELYVSEVNEKTEEQIEQEMFESYFPNLSNDESDCGIDEERDEGSENIVVEVKLENFLTEPEWNVESDIDSDNNIEVELFKSYFPEKTKCEKNSINVSTPTIPKPVMKKEGKKRRRIRAYNSKWTQMKKNLNKSSKVCDKITDEFVSEIESKVKNLVKRNMAITQSSNTVPRYMAVLEDGPFQKEGPVRCKICKKNLSSVKSLALHSQIHFGFDFICEICGKGFPTYSALDQHNMTRHGKEKKISCELCEYKAINNMELKIHERTHTGERPFVCDICGRDFHRRRCLVNHKYRHTNIKNYKCEKCSKAFISTSELKDHCNNVHERRYLYGCHLCDTTYAKICSVRSHLVTAHGLPRNQQGKVLRVNVTQ